MVSAAFTHAGAGTPAARWRAHPARAALPPLDLTAHARVVVVAAHPDDESLGAGGLTALAHRTGIAVTLVVATAGEHSHPRSPTTAPAELARRRGEESRAAWRALGPTEDPLLLGLEDGDLAAHQDDLTTRLVREVGDGRRTLLVAPWRHDGHPDHEAAGRAAAAAARRTGADLVEYPVWFWHWGDPDAAPWNDLVALRLEPEDVVRKARAIASHRTQVAPLSPAPGDETLLGPDLLAHFAAEDHLELLVRQPAVDDALDREHAEHEEPWDVDRRWYERRKRDLVLAALPRERFGAALEVGCSTGALAAALAPRCDALVALDSSPAALARAEARLRDLDGVRTVLADVPAGWPQGRFDLVVLSEVLYFLSPRDVEAVADRVAAAVAEDGVVVLCHWRHDVDGWVLDGPGAQRLLLERLTLPVAARYVDRDVEVVVLAAPGTMPDPTA
ncbi:bifunctional PIG-L family deacetylase/class I SAM-dependent methyltransferase [Nocardioides dongxiaopingii]|nr:bifunctional PIG-L family deacetylase/class I SAM-dependent methyltransferase [Nocardioides sp. S-1144]